MAPLPTLTSIGTLGTETVLVDLERLGSVGLQGDEDGLPSPDDAHGHRAGAPILVRRRQRHPRGLGAAPACHSTPTGSPIPDPLHGIAQGLTARVREVTAALTGLDTGVVQARSQDIAGDSWTPHVLLIDATGFETGRPRRSAPPAIGTEYRRPGRDSRGDARWSQRPHRSPAPT